MARSTEIIFLRIYDDIQPVFPPSFRNNINMSLFSKAFTTASKAKGEAFQRSNVVPRNDNN